MIAISLIVVVVVAALVILLVSQSGGPRVTTIERKTDHKKNSADA